MGRVVFVVLDGLGIGALPDAERYGDAGSDTLGNLSRVVELRLPFFESLGLGNIAPVQGVPPVARPRGLVGRLAPRSAGKDTTVGHWEHMGLVTPRPFPTYPGGFPAEVVEAFGALIGRGILGNRPASGTVIIEELGPEHLASGKPIVYTSSDSVFQIAAHVDVVPLGLLYDWCRKARGLLRGEHAVARVIARPFRGAPGKFIRTTDRRDFSLAPTGPTYLDRLAECGVPVLAVGKIGEIFAGRGLTETIKVGSNGENLALLNDLVRGKRKEPCFASGLLVTNLVDFDMLWGHRNDVDGFARGLAEADKALGDVVDGMGADDQLVVTADHGVDPTTVSTDHSREYVPVLLYPRPKGVPGAVYDGDFADTGAGVFERLTGRTADLEGRPMEHLQPSRGWRRYTSAEPGSKGSRRMAPCRLGGEEVTAAGQWLAKNVGPAPEMAVVLGSGLSALEDRVTRFEVPYQAVPHWAGRGVEGHPLVLTVATLAGRTWAFLAGRVHEYEGFDPSETQLAVRSLASWGVKKLVLTTAAGAVDQQLVPGSLVMPKTVLDLQHRRNDGGPILLSAFPASLAIRSTAKDTALQGLAVGRHASVPGPQYETPAELAVLEHMGAATVSMSPAGELRAAHEEGVEAVVLVIVTNVGHVSHAEVLTGSAAASARVSSVLAGLAAAWR